jgi:hypothetical protein
MGYATSFTPQESDRGLYQVLLLKKKMRVHTKFYSSRITWYRPPSDSIGVKLGTDPHLIL